MTPARALNAFLHQYLEDGSTGTRRSLEAYQALFAGHEELIAEQYGVLDSPGDPSIGRKGTLDRVGPYRILREIGRGGQGVVYLAEDERIRRRVALKMLTGLGSLAPERVARFLREAEVASRLDHPGIATMYETGTDGGLPYIAMRYVEGETLAKRIESSRESTDGRRAQDPRAIASIIEKAARALHAAHEAGVIHRDIKPGNILITASDEPVILDFGLAHDGDGELATLTKTGDFFGTPAYMSPEQIETQQTSPDRRTDVWSLGATLYECLTLARPFDAPTREGLYQAILTKEPLEADRLRPEVPKDLRVIAQTALQKERDKRYQTAASLADDLRAFLDGRPIAARPLGLLGTLVRWSRREPAKALLLVVLVLSLPTIAGFTTHFFANQEVVNAARLRALHDANDELMSLGSFLHEDGKLPKAIESFQQAVDLEGGSRDAVVSIALTYIENDRPTEGLAVLADHASLVDGTLAASILRSWAFRRLGRDSEADALLRDALAPTDAMDFYLESIELRVAGDEGRQDAYREALESATQAILLSRSPRLLFYAALIQANEHVKDPVVAVQAARALREHWSSSATAWFWQGYSLGNGGKHEEAITAYRESLRLEPEQPRVHNNIGKQLCELGRHEEAAAAFRVVIRNHTWTEMALVHCNLGGVLLRLGREEEALAEFKQALLLDRSCITALMNHARVLASGRSFAEAETLARRAVRLKPKRAEAHATLGLVLGKAGDVDASIRAYREALRLKPDFPEARSTLATVLRQKAWALMQSGEFHEAREVFAQGCEMGKAGAPGLDAEVAEKIETLIREEERLVRVISGTEEPKGTSDRLFLAELAHQTKRNELAAGWFREVFDADPEVAHDLEKDLLRIAARSAVAAAFGAPDSRPNVASQWRQQALDWLVQDLGSRRRSVDEGSLSEEQLLEWANRLATDEAFAKVRAPDALVRMPADERTRWEAFWSSVPTLAQAPTSR